MAKKVHHNPDYTKNKTADVIKLGSGPVIEQGHWEVNKDLTPKGESDGWGAFLPRPGYERPTPHTKTNECDH